MRKTLVNIGRPRLDYDCDATFCKELSDKHIIFRQVDEQSNE